MMGKDSEQIWNLDQVHSLIEGDLDAGGHKAVEKIVNDVRAITDKISEDSEKVITGLYVGAEVTSTKLKAEAKEAVAAIQENATKAAADLLQNVKAGEDPKKAAAIAKNIMNEAEKTTVELNRQSDKSIKALTDQAEATVLKFQRVAEAQTRHLNQLSEKAVKKLADTTKEMAAQFLVSEQDGAADIGKRLAAAEIIKLLAQASDEVHQAADKATAKIQKAAEEAILIAKEAGRDAATSVQNAIGDANQKILEVTQNAITETVGESEVEFFDLAPLKERWSKPRV